MEEQAEKIFISHLPREVTQLVIRGNMPLLKAWRIHLDMPCKEVAAKSGLDEELIADMEGQENMLSDELKKIAQALGVDVDLLVDREPEADPSDIYI